MRVAKRVPTGIQDVVNQLQDNNFHVNINHDMKSRTTTLKIEHNINPLSAVGVSHCAPGDNFDRATGTKIAFTRTMSDLRAYIGREGIKTILK